MNQIVIQKLAKLADELDALGQHKAADLIDAAIKKIAEPTATKLPGQLIGKPYQENGKWYHKYLKPKDQSLGIIEILPPETTDGEIVAGSVAPPEPETDQTWIQKRLNDKFNAWWQKSTGQTAPGNPTPVNQADDGTLASYGITVEKLDELIHILEVMRMELDPKFNSPEPELEEPITEDPWYTETAWNALEKDQDLR